jgi:hypothetical protein
VIATLPEKTLERPNPRALQLGVVEEQGPQHRGAWPGRRLMSCRQATSRTTRVQPDTRSILRQVQKALAVAAGIRIALDCGEDESFDTADSIAGLLSLLER